MRQNPNDELRKRIENLSNEIKDHFVMNKRNRVRKGIIPGNSKSLWKAVNIAKDVNSNEIPSKMYRDWIEINEEERSESFADFFENKISDFDGLNLKYQPVNNKDRF